MVLPVSGNENGGGLAVEFLGAGLTSTFVVERPTVHEPSGHVRVFRSQRFLPDPDRLAIIGLGFQIARSKAFDLGQIV